MKHISCRIVCKTAFSEHRLLHFGGEVPGGKEQEVALKHTGDVLKEQMTPSGLNEAAGRVAQESVANASKFSDKLRGRLKEKASIGETAAHVTKDAAKAVTQTATDVATPYAREVGKRTGGEIAREKTPIFKSTAEAFGQKQGAAIAEKTLDAAKNKVDQRVDKTVDTVAQKASGAVDTAKNATQAGKKILGGFFKK